MSVNEIKALYRLLTKFKALSDTECNLTKWQQDRKSIQHVCNLVKYYGNDELNMEIGK